MTDYLEKAIETYEGLGHDRFLHTRLCAKIATAQELRKLNELLEELLGNADEAPVRHTIENGEGGR